MFPRRDCGGGWDGGGKDENALTGAVEEYDRTSGGGKTWMTQGGAGLEDAAS